MSIIIVTNRNLVAGATDDALFGDEYNTKGPSELRIAKADYASGSWQVSLVEEPEPLDPAALPSRMIFDEVRRSLIDRGRHCVVFLHAFNQPFATSLKKCKEIQDTYGVEVIGFSWPSNTGGIGISEYVAAKASARLSVNALDRMLQKLSTYLGGHLLEDCGLSFNLLAHGTSVSMLENLVRLPLFSRRARIFDNVILHQADVDNPNHAEWVDRARIGKRVYITLNESDHVLKWADLNFQPDRLGNTCKNLKSKHAKYVDFTDTDLVESAHRIYWKSRHNPHVRGVFRRALHGSRAEIGDGLSYDPEKSVYSVS